jgi:hypothetical protein
MAEEEKAPGKTESLIQVSPEFAEIVSAAIKSRQTRPQEPEVEGHAVGVEQFSTDPGSSIVCGVVYYSPS